MIRFLSLSILLSLCLPLVLCADDLESLPIGWIKANVLAAPEARQAAAADERFVYAIDNRVIAKYDRASGKLVSRSQGDAHHLNSGFFYQGKLYCAHSNYPQKPEQSEIKRLDPQTMQLSNFHAFSTSPHGSLTVVLREAGAWWCVFAIYGKGENGRTALVKFDDDWRELGVWKFPKSVVSDLGGSSISGGVWMDGFFLATGHDKRVIYRLALPEESDVLQHLETVGAPFPGQGIAVDPVTGGLVGIDRQRREVVFAKAKL